MKILHIITGLGDLHPNFDPGLMREIETVGGSPNSQPRGSPIAYGL